MNIVYNSKNGSENPVLQTFIFNRTDWFKSKHESMTDEIDMYRCDYEIDTFDLELIDNWDTTLI